eukprot:g2416.t1
MKSLFKYLFILELPAVSCPKLGHHVRKLTVSMSKVAKMHDIAVFGATGAVGQACAAYLSQCDEPILWCIAGRSEAKLQDLASKLGAAEGVKPACLVADCFDRASLLAMTSQAVIDACIEGGAHYCDITGEVPWVTRMAAKYGQRAKQARVRIVSFCGYDSIPSDLSVLLAHKTLQKDGGVSDVTTFHRTEGAVMPPGTLDTVMLNMSLCGRAARRPRKGGEGKEAALAAADTNLVNGSGPAGHSAGPVTPYSTAAAKAVLARSMTLSSLLPCWHPLAKIFTPPGFMAGVNTPVVAASAAALGYATHLIYRERCLAGSLAANQSLLTLYGLLPSLLILWAYLLLAQCAVVGFLPFVLKVFFTVAGWLDWLRGSTKKKGLTSVLTFASSANRTAHCQVVFSYPLEPAINLTALLACESALVLSEKLKGQASLPGVWSFATPASAMGQVLLERLRAVGLTIDAVRNAAVDVPKKAK